MTVVSALYTDLYQLSMGQVYFLQGRYQNPAVFDYFFRKLPFGGGFVVFAGLGELLPLLHGLRFSEEDIEYLRRGGFHPSYLEYLAAFRFRGKVLSVREGEVVFPNAPAMRIEGTLLETQLIETLLLNTVNFQSLIATKAARVRQVAGKRVLADFGLRRAQGLGAMQASRAAFVGGFHSTSNVAAASRYGIPVSGTMAHSFVQQYDSELEAFRSFASGRPEKCVLLVDTYDTLGSGVPNAITVAKEMEQRGQRLEGIRLDSGDLAYLARASRKMLDDSGLHYVRIAASNQLDEYVIKSLLEQEAPIDIFGVGTSLVTGQPDAALDGVYKLAFANGKPRIKLSESVSKTTLPDRKQVLRVLDEAGQFRGADAVALENERAVEVMHHLHESDKSIALRGWTQEPLLEVVMRDGEPVADEPALSSIASFARSRLALLPREYKRFENPHTYKVGMSTALRELRDSLRKQYKKPSAENPL